MPLKYLFIGEEKYFSSIKEKLVKDEDDYAVYNKKTELSIPADADIVVCDLESRNKIEDIWNNLDPSVFLLSLNPTPLLFSKIIDSGNVLSLSSSSPLEVKDIIEKIKLRKKLEESLKRKIIGHSKSTKRLRAQIILSSQSNLPIHLCGETGTGKTLGSKMIHKLSGNRKKLVYMNCSNLNSQIIDSDLFGHTKGAFTSSCDNRNGLVASADGTTLVLDEVGDLPLETQGKLLDTIESGTFRHMGADTETNSNFRLITAGALSLDELLEKHKLREDFFYRIKGITLSIEPLRKHIEDIPDLIQDYEDRNYIAEGRIKDFSPFMNCYWKGNIRELLHFLDRIYVNSLKLH